MLDECRSVEEVMRIHTKCGHDTHPDERHDDGQVIRSIPLEHEENGNEETEERA